jgi:hypothetical protein
VREMLFGFKRLLMGLSGEVTKCCVGN